MNITLLVATEAVAEVKVAAAASTRAKDLLVKSVASMTNRAAVLIVMNRAALMTNHAAALIVMNQDTQNHSVKSVVLMTEQNHRIVHVNVLTVTNHAALMVIAQNLLIAHVAALIVTNNQDQVNHLVKSVASVATDQNHLTVRVAALIAMNQDPANHLVKNVALVVTDQNHLTAHVAALTAMNQDQVNSSVKSAALMTIQDPMTNRAHAAITMAALMFLNVRFMNLNKARITRKYVIKNVSTNQRLIVAASQNSKRILVKIVVHVLRNPKARKLLVTAPESHHVMALLNVHVVRSAARTLK